MAHRYGKPIQTRHTTGEREDDIADTRGAPAAFCWRGVWYQVDETLSAWRLRDRWWAAPAADVADVAGLAGDTARPFADALLPTERSYYRVLCRGPEGEQVFDLYYDAASGQWVLDRIHD